MDQNEPWAWLLPPITSSIAQWIEYLPPDPAVTSSNHDLEVFSKEISDVVMSIDSALLRASGPCKAQKLIVLASDTLVQKKLDSAS